LYLRGRNLIESGATDSHFLGNDARAVVVPEIEALDINSEFDFEMAEMIMARRGATP
jgi:CMP-N-acetylneuraminic acid synthetase